MKGFVLRPEARTCYIVWHSSFPYVMCHHPNFSSNPASVFPSRLSSRLRPEFIDDAPQSDIFLLTSCVFARLRSSHMLHDYGDPTQEVRRRASQLWPSCFIVLHLTMSCRHRWEFRSGRTTTMVHSCCTTLPTTSWPLLRAVANGFETYRCHNFPPQYQEHLQADQTIYKESLLFLKTAQLTTIFIGLPLFQ
jgi:hypothetical protein